MEQQARQYAPPQPGPSEQRAYGVREYRTQAGIPMNSVRAREFGKIQPWPQTKPAAGRTSEPARGTGGIRRDQWLAAWPSKYGQINCSFDWPRDNKRGVEASSVGPQKEQKVMIDDGKEAYHGRTEYSRIRDLSRS